VIIILCTSTWTLVKKNIQLLEKEKLGKANTRITRVKVLHFMQIYLKDNSCILWTVRCTGL
jgi:hypothetical protein